MTRFICSLRAAAGTAAIALVSATPATALQLAIPRVHIVPAPKAESVTVAASTRYRAGPFMHWLVGGANRDLWAIPIRVPVFNWQAYAGGLHPTKEGGGMQTKSLRFETAAGVEYVFRLSDKSATGASGQLKDTPVDGVFQDQVSAQHPAAAQIAAAIVEASGVLHPTAVLVYMPNDTALGKYRSDFADRLGMIEEFPSVPKTGLGFGGATKIIDSPDLLLLLNTDATQRVDARAFLTARLTDFLINDNDRHAGNWKWARLDSGSKKLWNRSPATAITPSSPMAACSSRQRGWCDRRSCRLARHQVLSASRSPAGSMSGFWLDWSSPCGIRSLGRCRRESPTR